MPYDFEHKAHPFEPVFDKNSKLLILGSFPSVRSMEEGFYYGHVRNRFWPVMAAVLGSPIPQTVQDKKDMLLRHGIALWDSAAQCVIKGSADASMREIVPNDVGRLISQSGIRHIFANGKTAGDIYNKYILPKTGIPAVVLPSTSPANAAFTAERLIEHWRVVGELCEK